MEFTLGFWQIFGIIYFISSLVTGFLMNMCEMHNEEVRYAYQLHILSLIPVINPIVIIMILIEYFDNVKKGWSNFKKLCNFKQKLYNLILFLPVLLLISLFYL